MFKRLTETFRSSSRNNSRRPASDARLEFHSLEDRRMLAVITVTSLADNLIPGSGVTLREAVQAANTDTSVDGSVAGSGDDTIVFDASLAGQTILLGTELEIDETLTIDATALAVGVTIDANELSRIFNITATTGDFTLAGLTLTSGKTTGSNVGSTDSTFSGGAIRSLTTGSLTIDRSTVSESSTAGAAAGGGIFSTGDLVLTNSTVSGNSTAGLFGFGGGIIAYGTTSIHSSTISGNSTTGNAGGGGGIFAYGSMTISSSTISGNSTAGNLADGGGLFMYHPTSVPTLTIQNSILAGNTAGGSNPDLSPGTGTKTVDFSLIGDTTGSGVTGATGTGNLLDQDPLLGPLADNGGPTQTHELLPGSPAIDTGDPSILFDANEFDQRGTGTPGFVRVFDGDASAGARIDMGAFEARTIDLVVDTLLDESDGDFSAGNLSLREAVELTNPNPGDDTITFDATVFAMPQTIALALGEIEITSSLNIDATLANKVTIDAQQNSRLINFSALTGDLALDGIQLQNGRTTANGFFGVGGGIHFQSNGTLSLTGSTLSGNSTTGSSAFGGGIFALAGDTILTNSTLSDNSTTGQFSRGGGIATTSGDVTLTNSTLSGNSTLGDDAPGGGIRTYSGAVTLNNSTLSGNSTAGIDSDGGGIFTYSGDVTLANSTLAKNKVESFSDGGGIFVSGIGVLATISHSIVAGNEVLDGNNSPADLFSHLSTNLIVDFSLIGSNANSGLGEAQTPDSNGNLIGGNLGSTIDPLLGVLADRGGTTPTHALLAGSPAIDAGDPLIVAPPANDQRGAPFLRQIGTIDIGAFEVQEIPSPSLVVDTLIDENDGDYTSGDLSLREAISLANTIVSINSITFDAALSGDTIDLSQALGELAIVQNVTIDASSLDNGITIDAGDGTDNTFATGDGIRIFNIDDGTATEIDVELVGLTLTGGDLSSGFGGAIISAENLTISGSTIIGNSASVGGGGIDVTGPTTIISSTFNGNSSAGIGGAIFSHSSVLTVLSSTISENSAGGTGGGIGIAFSNTNTIITSTTISSNVAEFDGGGIATSGIAMTITASTLAGNSTGRNGGGIRSQNGATTTITSSTITGNSADRDGGGIHVKDVATTTITSSTITDNRADSDNDGLGLGGGIRRFSSGSVALSHTLVAGNEKGTSTRDDVSGAVEVTSTFNLIGVDTGLTGISDGTSGNQVGTSIAPLDPLLGALADNGGPTQTHALLVGSPAIDAGDPGIVFAANEFDQRGAPFVRVANGDVNGVQIDIGAYESIVLIVDTLVDENDGDYTSGDLSLREAIDLANSVFGAETITFAAALDGGTIDLQQALGELPITDALAIDASSLATGITIDAGDGTDNTFATGDGIRIFNIDDGTATEIDVELVGMTLTGGDASSAGGGAISSQENLTITSSTIRDNSASDDGGGIFVNSAAVTITSSTISGNSTGGDGGGIRIVSGTTTITSSTISGNSASDDGGGIFVNSAAVTITSSTISGNSTGGDGGGIRIVSGTTTIASSTISGNSASDDGGAIQLSGTSTIIDSTISGNTAQNDSGGIYIISGTTTIDSSTISGNTAGIDGGGVRIRLGTTNITSSTISGNSAGDEGGGVFSALAGVTATISHSTITDNRADNDNNGSGTGGGLRINLGNVTLSHVLVAGNDLGDNTADDISGSVAASSNFNLIGVDAGLTGISDGTAGNQIGSSVAPIDPLLGLLANNGGPTETHELLLGSPAINLGDPAIAAPPAFDQRGAGFPRQHGTIDIGAFEGQGLLLVVDTLVDENDGVISVGNFSLREAIEIANGFSGGDTIIFDAALNGGTIDLLQTLGELTITDEVLIDASSLGSGLTIDAGDGTDNLFDTNDGFRVFNINDGSGTTDFPVQLVNLTLTGGDLPNSGGTGGGAIDTQEDLTLTSVTIVGNSGFAGGGIRARFGTLTLLSSTISGNTANRGGGIYTSGNTTIINESSVSDNTGGGSGIGGGGIRSESGSSLTITLSTISGNSALGSDGGGISLQTSPLTIISSTVSGNSAGGDGGGIHESNTTVTMISSTISGNTADDDGGGIFATKTLTINASTITDNRADNDNNGFGDGGGIVKNGTLNSVVLINTLIAGNDLGNGTQDDISSSIPVDAISEFNLIGVDTGFTGITNGSAGNQIGTSGAPLEPLLGPLADNGGPTKTHALLAGSPAIDAGSNALAVDANGNPLLTDQRGDGFGRLIDGDDNGTTTVDIGAFEAASPFLLGDVDQNGVVNFLDIDPFIGVLVANAFQAEADINLDGAVTFLDIDPFIVLLSSPPSGAASAALTAAPSESSLQLSDGISVQLSAAPSSLSLPPSDVASTQFSAAPAESSLLTFTGVSQMQNRDGSHRIRNKRPFWNGESVAKQLSHRKADRLAELEGHYDAGSRESSPLDVSAEPIFATSSADLFDKHPELLNGLADSQLDKAFEELLI